MSKQELRRVEVLTEVCECLKQQGGAADSLFQDRSRRSAVEKWETRRVFQGGLIAVFSTAADGGELRRSAVVQR